MRLLIATKNPSKIDEIKRYIGLGFEFASLADFQDVPEIEETGKTFHANALLKARGYFDHFGIPTVADDGGIEILALNGEPGVKSRRWPGYEATDQELIDMTLSKLSGVPWNQRQARLVTTGAFSNGRASLTETAGVDGYIVESQNEDCIPGFPFRSIFWIPQFNKLFLNLTSEEHELINHRKKVYENLAGRIARLAL